MMRENPAHYVLIYASAEGKINLIRNAWAAPGWIAVFHLHHGANDVSILSFWSWFGSALR